MRCNRTWPLISAFLGCCIIGLTLIGRPCDKENHLVPTVFEPIKPAEVLSKPKRFINLTDSDILQDDTTTGWILNAMELYKQKLKLLQDREMLGTLRKGPDCTKKSKPMAMCHDQECKAKLPPIGSLENFQSVSKPLRAIQYSAIKRISEIFGTDVMKKRKYVFLLAITSNHYIEAQATIRTLHEKVFPYISNYTFYCYDMGLAKEQVYLLKKYGKAVVRKYPFHLLPPRIYKLKTYTWKPVLIQAHIDQAEFVIYSDASVRFVGNVDEMFHRAKYTGFLMCPGSHALAIQTSSSMFTYFGDDACSYSANNEYEGGFFVFHNEPFAKTVLLEPWVACALDPDCMSKKTLNEPDPKVRTYSQRHRFDLSAMTIILVKLFREHISSFNAPRGRYHQIKQGSTNVAHYLKELQSKYENNGR